MIGRDESNEVGILDMLDVQFERGRFEYKYCCWVRWQRNWSVGTDVGVSSRGRGYSNKLGLPGCNSRMTALSLYYVGSKSCSLLGCSGLQWL